MGAKPVDSPQQNKVFKFVPDEGALQPLLNGHLLRRPTERIKCKAIQKKETVKCPTNMGTRSHPLQILP